MTTKVQIAGLVLAGGKSSRFGAPKGQAMLGEASLAVHVGRALQVHVSALAIAGDKPEPDLNAIALFDPPGAPQGPLAGVLSGLEWAQRGGFNWLATAPCDAPLIPGDLVPRLLAGATISGARLTLAATSEGWQPLCALWRTDLAEELRAALAEGRHPSVHRFAEAAGVCIVQFEDADAFLNINTLEDLAQAKALLAQRS